MGKQNQELLENIKRYEEKKTKQQKSKVLGQKPVKREANSKKIHACTTHNGVKVYTVWYK